ncbi:hypothetical protein GCM10007047_11480 [Cerasicoccus arenae]|uniref:TIR domain-containing protein n=2 Tax=Cerasicoccus arenae TaxID=424488 RepID=A0A8J3GCX8_9BACT|nr:hypothetical protein GCM10007047_11480 [Cerasicoccus arenae]
MGRLAPDRFDFFASSSDVNPGADWANLVQEKIKNADWLIALMSQSSNQDTDFIVQEISAFDTLYKDDSSKLRIVIHEDGNRKNFFQNLQQFPTTKSGCKDFLRFVLSTPKDGAVNERSLGFNRYIGDDDFELDRESSRLWEILRSKPDPFVLVPKAYFRLNRDEVSMLEREEMPSSMSVVLNRNAADIHGLKLTQNSAIWEGCFGDMVNSMNEVQKSWLPQSAFLMRKLIKAEETQSAFILYPDNKNMNYYTPVVSELFKYQSGEIEYELIYFPVETGFSKYGKGQSDLDVLFHLLTLCFHMKWRILDRYLPDVSNLAGIERHNINELTEGQVKERADLHERIVIDFKKIHADSAARGITNPDIILSLFQEGQASDLLKWFHDWANVYFKIEKNKDTMTSVEMEVELKKMNSIYSHCLGAYAHRLADVSS